MRSAALCFVAISAALLLMQTPIAAHHAIAAKFDPDKSVTLTGTVVGIEWTNPHVHVFLDVKSGTRTGPLN